MSAPSTFDPESECDRALEIIKKHCQQLSEHFDTVQILATRHSPSEMDGTVTFRWGEGNWFARYGNVREWLISEEAKMKSGETL